MGDIVQPLHSIARFTADYTSGDAGGNGFSLPSKYSVRNLHALWDKVMYEERTSVSRPFTPETWAAF